MAFRTAVVGLGYWGPNLARNLAASDDFELVGLCDRDIGRLERVGGHFPSARCYADMPALLADVRPELVCIATPGATHFRLARAALAAGAHVLVEKPLAASVSEGCELLALAEQLGLRVFVDHTFLFTGAVQALHQQVRTGALGDLLYVDSVRINLGLFQSDVDVLWDLAPHDLAILQYLMPRPAMTVQAVGSVHNPRHLADVAYLHLDYGAGLTAHLHLSWLSPVKVRRMIFAGTQQSLIYDDMEATEKIKIYDHGVAFEIDDDADARRQNFVSYRKGDMRAPAIDTREALASEFTNIAQALRGEAPALATGADGLAIVRILAAATRSLAQNGATISLTEVGGPS